MESSVRKAVAEATEIETQRRFTIPGLRWWIAGLLTWTITFGAAFLGLYLRCPFF